MPSFRAVMRASTTTVQRVRRAPARAACAVAILLVVAGCAFRLTDVATLTRPGRYEVALPGAGVTLGGILFQPAATSQSAPGVIVLHGWAPAGVPGAARVAPVAQRLAERGYVALALSLRGWPNSSGRDDCGLKQPDDVVAAVGWLATVPGVDPRRIALLGFSQGGQVALLAAARTERVRAVVSYFAVTDIPRWAETTDQPDIRATYIPSVCEPGASVRSPVTVADRITAPVLLIHGDRDTRVPAEQALRMRDALQRAHRHVELRLVHGAGHGFGHDAHEAIWPAVTAFLDAHLARP